MHTPKLHSQPETFSATPKNTQTRVSYPPKCLTVKPKERNLITKYKVIHGERNSRIKVLTKFGSTEGVT